MRLSLCRTCLPVMLALAPPASAQNGPEPVAGLLASIRILKLECGVRPVPRRLTAAIEAAGYRLSDFLPRGRHYRLVEAELSRVDPPSRADRAQFCERLAERVRTSPLNRPQAAGQSAWGAGERSGLVDLNRASLEELNSLGAGLIGRTIIYGRPYRSPEDLVDRRILNGRDFARIKGRVTVR